MALVPDMTRLSGVALLSYAQLSLPSYYDEVTTVCHTVKLDMYTLGIQNIPEKTMTSHTFILPLVRKTCDTLLHITFLPR